jgi:hypothetical protein
MDQSYMSDPYLYSLDLSSWTCIKQNICARNYMIATMTPCELQPTLGSIQDIWFMLGIPFYVAVKREGDLTN